jgi:hypothetical protein
MITLLASSNFALSIMPSAVKGFTKDAAAYSNEISLSKNMQPVKLVTQKSAKVPPISYRPPNSNYFIKATFRPIKSIFKS